MIFFFALVNLWTIGSSFRIDLFLFSFASTTSEDVPPRPGYFFRKFLPVRWG